MIIPESSWPQNSDSFDWVFSWDLGTWSFYWDLSSEWPEALSKWFLETSGLGVVGEREWPHLMPSAGGQLSHHLDQSLLDTCCVWGIKPSAEREVWAIISWGGLELARGSWALCSKVLSSLCRWREAPVWADLACMLALFLALSMTLSKCRAAVFCCFYLDLNGSVSTINTILTLLTFLNKEKLCKLEKVADK